MTFTGWEKNNGATIINKWIKFPKIWGFASIQSTWQSIHLALATAFFLAQKKSQKCLFLELQSEGISIFSLLQTEPKASILQTDKDKITFKELLDDKVVRYHGVDILNVNHLSYWKLNESFWAALLTQFMSHYDHVIVHTGDEKLDFIYEQFDRVFILRKSATKMHGLFYPENNHILWPLCTEIFTHTGKYESSEEIIYPLFFQDTIEIASIPLPENLDEDYWKWFDHFLSHNFFIDNITIINDNFREETQTVINSFLEWNNNTPENSKNIIISENFASLWVPALLNNSNQDLKLWLKDLKINKLFSSLKATYPKTGFYSRKSFYNFFGKELQNLRQNMSQTVSAVYSTDRKDIHWFSAGNLLHNLSVALFPQGILDKEKDVEMNYEIGPLPENAHSYHIGRCFRAGFKKINYVDFSQNAELSVSTPVTNLLRKFESTERKNRFDGKIVKYLNL